MRTQNVIEYHKGLSAKKVFSLPWVRQIHAPTDGPNAGDVLDSAVELSLTWGKPRRLDGEAAWLKGIHVIGIKHARTRLSGPVASWQKC